MRGLRKPSTELERLASGLGNAEDPYCLEPLADKTIEQLAENAGAEIRYSALSMLRAGRCFMAIKKRLGHGKWEDFVVDQKWSWDYVRAAMKLLEVVARFPQLLHLPDGRVTSRLLRLSLPRIEDVVDGLPPEAVEKLTPWDLERIYHNQRVADSKLRGRKQRTPEQEEALKAEAARIKAEMDARDPAWDEIHRLWIEAAGKLKLLAHAAEKFEMRDEHYDEVWKLDMLRRLTESIETVTRKWHPIEEVRKRATIIERPSFAARK